MASDGSAPDAGERTPARDLAGIALFVVASALPFLDQAYHFDEPYQLYIARQILRSPLHPQNFLINWHGTAMPMAEFNTHPLLVPYLLALPLRLTHGREWMLRLLCLPFDLLAAAALYLLAARFLERPRWPVLIALATPAYFINMGHLMTEKWVGAFGFAGLYALVRGLEEGSAAWYWGSAALIAAACLCKYSAAFLLFPAAVFCLRRRMPPRGVLEYCGLALLPAALHLALGTAVGAGGAGAVVRMLSDAAAFPWSSWTHRLRSELAFIGGCGGLLAVWPLFLKGAWRRAAAALAGAGLLFLPKLDFQPVAPLDRGLGVLFAAGGILALWVALDAVKPGPRRADRAGDCAGGEPPWRGGRASRPTSGEALESGDAGRASNRDDAGRSEASAFWSEWFLAVAALQLIDWSVVSRFILFLLPPLAFELARRLEARMTARRLRRLYRLSFAGTLALTLGLALVDRYYADAQKNMAGGLARDFLSKGRRVWFTGHWGLQYYMELVGARGIDAGRGGWGEVRQGDVVVVPENNSEVISADRVFPRVRVEGFRIDFPIPLRLIGGGPGGQAGFYSSAWGFLPFDLSRAPVDAFQVVGILSDPLPAAPAIPEARRGRPPSGLDPVAAPEAAPTAGASRSR